jgi:hypothetical protein
MNMSEGPNGVSFWVDAVPGPPGPPMVHYGARGINGNNILAASGAIVNAWQSSLTTIWDSGSILDNVDSRLALNQAGYYAGYGVVSFSTGQPTGIGSRNLFIKKNGTIFSQITYDGDASGNGLFLPFSFEVQSGGSDNVSIFAQQTSGQSILITLREINVHFTGSP